MGKVSDLRSTSDVLLTEKWDGELLRSLGE